MASDLGYWVWVAAAGTVWVGIGLWKSLASYLPKRREKRRLAVPCEHQVVGARADPTFCSRCVAETEERERKERAREIGETRRRLAERQRKYDEWKQRVRTPEYLRTMDPREFEKLVCTLYEQMGYRAEVTQYTSDGGIDGYLRRDGKVTLLQCKRVKGSVGEPVLRDLYGTMTAENADEGIVVTTGKVSRQATAWAADKPIQIIELDELTALVRQHLDEAAVVPDSFEVESVPEAISMICPECGRRLRKKKGKYGPFLGCSGYPSCRFTRDMRTRRR